MLYYEVSSAVSVGVGSTAEGSGTLIGIRGSPYCADLGEVQELVVGVTGGAAAETRPSEQAAERVVNTAMAAVGINLLALKREPFVSRLGIGVCSARDIYLW